VAAAKPRYRAVRALEYVVGGDARHTVRVPVGAVLDGVLLSDLPLVEAAPMLDMLARDEAAGRMPPTGYAFFHLAGQLRSAVYARDVVAVA
jgi:hypothetical protein